MIGNNMTIEQLAVVQQLAQEKWGVGKVQFAETLLCTSYDTYKKWMNGTNKMAGAAQPAASLVSYAIEHNWSLEALINQIKSQH